MSATTHHCPLDVIVIGCSTGGPQALHQILPLLPADLPVPVLVVQHMPDGFTALLADRLDGLCAVSVVEASDGDVIRPGVVYVGRSGCELVLRRQGARVVLRVAVEPEPTLHVPSIDRTMTHAAKVFGCRALGVLLTGMGADGAQGLLAIHEAGGPTLAEDETTAVVFGMPRAAGELGAVDADVPLDEIVPSILRLVRGA